MSYIHLYTYKSHVKHICHTYKLTYTHKMSIGLPECGLSGWYLWKREPISGDDAGTAAASVLSSLGEEWWEEGGVCTLLGCTGMP